MAESSGTRVDDAQVVTAVSTWISETGELLQQIQGLLEGGQVEAPAFGLIPNDLLPRLRQCRAQMPCPDAVRAWVGSMATRATPDAGR